MYKMRDWRYCGWSSAIWTRLNELHSCKRIACSWWPSEDRHDNLKIPKNAAHTHITAKWRRMRRNGRGSCVGQMIVSNVWKIEIDVVREFKQCTWIPHGYYIVGDSDSCVICVRALWVTAMDEDKRIWHVCENNQFTQLKRLYHLYIYVKLLYAYKLI